MSKKQKHIVPLYLRDSTKLKGKEVFTPMYKSMYMSKSYRELKPTSKDLYTGMLMWRKTSDDTEVEFSYTLALNILNSTATISKAIEDLGRHGFIEIVRFGCFSNKTTATYKFSTKWKELNGKEDINWRQIK